MGIFNKLFGDKSKSDNPDNTKLLELLEIYRIEKGKGDCYKNVLSELLNGNSFLMFATKDDSETEPDKWTTLEKMTTLKMDNSLLNVDGVKVLMTFTDEQALLNWFKQQSSRQYTAMKSKDVLEFAQYNDIGRIIINQGIPTMYVIERNKNIKEHKITKDSKIQLGTPAKPLNNLIIQKLTENFKRDNTISEVFQYLQSKNDEVSLVLGIKLTANSSNAKSAAINAVQNAMQNQKLEYPLDIFFIETQEWYDRIAKIEYSSVYKK